MSVIKSKAKKCNRQYVRSTTIELKTRFRNRKMSKKTNKNSFEVADSNRTPYTIKLLFQCKDKKKTQVMIQKDRSRKIERLAYWARNYLSISLLG